MFRKALLFITLSCSINLNAQISENIKVGIEPGFLILSASENIGLLMNVEPKLKVTKHNFMGLRIAAVINPQRFRNHDTLQYTINDEYDNGGFSFVPTFDIYLSQGKLRPYIGLGAGAYLLTNYVNVFSTDTGNEFEVKIKKQIGALLRCGIESHKLRFGLEYNLVQPVDVQIPEGKVIGTVNNSYLGLTVGLILQ
ncbi:MAG: hypothetical protein MRY83_11295 [Flavobacteriales bacterium]|nr:hypothetical protein [Flavobacteriales bacterium]